MENNKEKIPMIISPVTVMQLEKLLDTLIEKSDYSAQIGNIKIKYIGKDDIEKRDMFYIER